MKETRMPPEHAANLVANSGDALYGVYVVTELEVNLRYNGKVLLLELVVCVTHGEQQNLSMGEVSNTYWICVWMLHWTFGRFKFRKTILHAHKMLTTW